MIPVRFSQLELIEKNVQVSSILRYIYISFTIDTCIDLTYKFFFYIKNFGQLFLKYISKVKVPLFPLSSGDIV